MTQWHLLTYLGVVTVGVLGFLRVVTNELDLADRAVKAEREAEAARKPPPEPGEIAAERAA